MKKKTDQTFELLTKAAKNIAHVAANSSFELWQRKDFRLYVEFGNISQTEQDRIFNELEVSILGLFSLHLDYALSVIEKDYKIAIQTLQNELIPSFLEIFKELGIEEKYIKQWNLLIKLRFEEYRRDYKVALKESNTMKEFKVDDEALRVAWARIETITIDCLNHVRRGNVEKDDPLWSLIRKWLITLDASLNSLTTLGPKEHERTVN